MGRGDKERRMAQACGMTTPPSIVRQRFFSAMSGMNVALEGGAEGERVWKVASAASLRGFRLRCEIVREIDGIYVADEIMVRDKNFLMLMEGETWYNCLEWISF